MGTAVGQSDPDVAAGGASAGPLMVPERLRDRPWDFSFFQTVRLLGLLSGAKAPLGSFAHPAREPVRFATNPSLAFPAAEIQALRQDGPGPPAMAVNFFGLTGALGILPKPYTELVLERLHARDATFRDFLDIFNHRLISLLYRAWEKYRFPVAYERSGEDPVSGYLLALIGLGMPHLRGRQVISDQALIGYEGLLVQFPRSATAFRQILTDYFGIPVEVEPFAGCWRPLDSASQTVLAGGFSRSEQLGTGVVMGDEVWDQQSLVRLRLGPMPLTAYHSFLPGGAAHQPLRGWARFFCGEDVDVEVQLVLQREDAPRCSLGAPEDPEPHSSAGAAAGQAPRLGWVSWLFTKPLDRDPDETVMRLWE